MIPITQGFNPLNTACAYLFFSRVFRALLIEIKNPCAGKVDFLDGLPYSGEPGHGYGCRSISTIARRCHGLCDFKAENGIFTMRVALPML